jgi:hypothetical protein
VAHLLAVEGDDFKRNFHANAGGTFAGIAKLSKTQHQHTVARNAGGAMRTLYLLQPALPSLCAGSASNTDGMSDFAASPAMGIPLEDFRGPVRDQAHLPQRNGNGYHAAARNASGALLKLADFAW